MTRTAIVGGGIAGLSAAAVLAEAGHEVILFEAEPQFGYHASGRSAAIFEENYGNTTVRALNRATAPVLSEMDVLSPRAIMLLALQSAADQFRTDVTDLDMIEIPVAEARLRVPILSDEVAFAAIHEGAMDVDTDALMQGFVKAARKAGARVETSAKVEAISTGEGLRASGVECSADVIVNAAGAWADEVARLAEVAPVGLKALRRSMARLPAPGGQDVRDWPMLLGAGEAWYAKPDAGAWIVSPAEEDPVQPTDAWADDLVLAEGLARYEAHVTEPVIRVDSNWAGLRTFAPDRSLVVGEDPEVSGFFWLAGQGGYGFQSCAGAAVHLLAMIEGRDSPLGHEVTEAVAPGRFRSR